jgi:hypothetical protein
MKDLFQKRPQDPVPAFNEPDIHEKTPKKQRRNSMFRSLHPNMIRRMDATPQLVDPNGWISHSPMSTPMALRPEPLSEETRTETSNIIAATPLQTIPSGQATEKFLNTERSPENHRSDGAYHGRLNNFERKNSASSR